MKGERLGEFEEFTLLAVRALGDTYAVPIQQYVEKVTARPISMGSIYAALTRLEEKGFLRSTMSEAVAQRGGKSKRVYSVTPSGSASRSGASPRPRADLERDRRRQTLVTPHDRLPASAAGFCA